MMKRYSQFTADRSDLFQENLEEEVKDLEEIDVKDEKDKLERSLKTK